MAGMRTKTQLSIVSPTGYTSSTCGYCSAPGSGKRSATKSSKSYGIWTHRLSPYHYQSLIDQGWRRSGDYVYKPDLSRTCCAQIPIRLDAHEFRPKKAHKRALTNLLFRVRQTKPKPAKWKGRWSRHRDWEVEQRWNEIVPPFADEHNATSGSSPTWAENVAGPITRKLQVRLALAATSNEKYQLFRKYQARIHGESEQCISKEEGFRRFLVDSSLALTWPSSGLPLTPSQETQWRAKSLDPANLPQELPYGCYHQEYRLDDSLIAVGVLDLLPGCVSSVYVFYDPDYNDWELGKVSALQEIALARRLGRLEAMQGITRYYMGFYIHTCQKMKYKAEYRPSQLLDCSSNTWHHVTDVASELDANRYFAWSGGGKQQSVQMSESDKQDFEHVEDENQDESVVRVPTQPAPPPGMLNATTILDVLQQTVRGSVPRIPEPGLDLLQHAMVLEAQKQAEGIKPLLISDLFRDYVQDRPHNGNTENAEFVHAVECIAALARPELVAEMVVFI